jgi:hypothetical protein
MIWNNIVQLKPGFLVFTLSYYGLIFIHPADAMPVVHKEVITIAYCCKDGVYPVLQIFTQQYLKNHL